MTVKNWNNNKRTAFHSVTFSSFFSSNFLSRERGYLHVTQNLNQLSPWGGLDGNAGVWRQPLPRGFVQVWGKISHTPNFPPPGYPLRPWLLTTVHSSRRAIHKYKRLIRNQNEGEEWERLLIYRLLTQTCFELSWLAIAISMWNIPKRAGEICDNLHISARTFWKITQKSL